MNLDANPHNADWIKVLSRAREFEEWTSATIDSECRADYTRYHGDVRARHVAYYDARPEERHATYPFGAARRNDAFPPDWGNLAQAIGSNCWHKHHLSGASSQTLAIALLTAAKHEDSSLSWLPRRETLGVEPLATLFEVELAPHVLNERPRQTAIDWLTIGSDGVLVAEAKFTERGFGTCSCEGMPHCSPRVLDRPYWAVAAELLGLLRNEGQQCSLSLAYQPVRNLAAARAIAGPHRAATFLLLYDRRNPYFTGSGRWPGWVRVLLELGAYSSVGVCALSWQELVVEGRVSASVADWASEKHGIAPNG